MKQTLIDLNKEIFPKEMHLKIYFQHGSQFVQAI